MLNEKSQEILRTLKKENGFVDDHDKKFHTLTEGPWPLTVVKFSRINRPEEIELCPVYICRACSINPFYMSDDNKVHLSTWSIGGVVYNGDIDEYNKGHATNPGWSRDQLEIIYDPE